MRKIIMVVMVAVAGVAGAATYYVDSEIGRDDAAWGGGPSDPWRTITYALSRVSGENTFMCRGTFVEEVEVGRDDYNSKFVANTKAAIKGSIVSIDEVVILELEDFDVLGFAAGGCKGYLGANGCYFYCPSGPAFRITRFHGRGGAFDCVFEGCKPVMNIPGFEFGTARFERCEIKDCANGISYSGEASVSAMTCTFKNVTETAFNASMWGEFATVSECEIANCGMGVVISGSQYGASGTVKDSLFRYNNTPLKIRYYNENWGGVEIKGNLVTENHGSGVDAGGVRIGLRGNVIRDNDGHGVYISEGDPDLGTPGDPGGNTFAGNKSGYDVYNVSPENIPAYGNSWDPQSGAEMAGKTWREVNVTRIYDHWDDPNVGYVMWSEPMLGLAPASLGQIKASFQGEAPSGSVTTTPSTAVR